MRRNHGSLASQDSQLCMAMEWERISPVDAILYCALIDTIDE